MGRKGDDIIGVLRGLQLVVEAVFREQNQRYRNVWSNSSIKEVFDKQIQNNIDYCQRVSAEPMEEVKRIRYLAQETQERTAVVVEGMRQLLLVKVDQYKESLKNRQSTESTSSTADEPFHQQRVANPVEHGFEKVNVKSELDAANLDLSSVTLKELEEFLANRKLSRESSSPPLQSSPKKQAKSTPPPTARPTTPPIDVDNEYTSSSLVTVAKQRRVPSSRLGRIASFGGLFAGLGLGTINELTKGALGLGGTTDIKKALLSPNNAERIVDTLCKVRGAALKIGQILSIQDSNVVSPELSKAFERVRQAADYMPDWQVERVLSDELGNEWRLLLEEFEMKPFAAASIGQVHRGKLKNGMTVAIKLQYPGVAQSIESDIDNLIGMLKLWNVFPQGFFIDNVVKVAKRELKWEVDYKREAEFTEKFKELVAPHKSYYVPKVVQELSTTKILTTEFVPGIPLDKCFQMSYDHRSHIGELVLKLCLLELFEFKCMQTDPNWSNFLYDYKSRRLMLIDFGSTRFYTEEFIDNYRKVIMCAVGNDRQGVLDISREMGFLTGYESKQMEEAHVDAVMILGEMFRCPGQFDFGQQDTTKRIANLVPTMVAHRLCPPPEEIYSIHRKLSGIFLLCSRLNISLRCRDLYEIVILKRRSKTAAIT